MTNFLNGCINTSFLRTDGPWTIVFWLLASTPLKNMISSVGKDYPIYYGKTKNAWKHQSDIDDIVMIYHDMYQTLIDSGKNSKKSVALETPHRLHRLTKTSQLRWTHLIPERLTLWEQGLLDGDLRPDMTWPSMASCFFWKAMQDPANLTSPLQAVSDLYRYV